mmetsp:Transcript_7369/g.12388  ORF Transcript_7369/g.12388 Transcript_7369/m.12388 type:complete len:150 (+) Transcript_7369:333-782(+)
MEMGMGMEVGMGMGLQVVMGMGLGLQVGMGMGLQVGMGVDVGMGIDVGWGCRWEWEWRWFWGDALEPCAAIRQPTQQRVKATTFWLLCHMSVPLSSLMKHISGSVLQKSRCAKIKTPACCAPIEMATGTVPTFERDFQNASEWTPRVPV